MNVYSKNQKHLFSKNPPKKTTFLEIEREIIKFLKTFKIYIHKQMNNKSFYGKYPIW